MDFCESENVESALSKAINVNLSRSVEIVKFPNYSGDNADGDSNFTVERWDAIKTTWGLTINNSCLKKIIF